MSVPGQASDRVCVGGYFQSISAETDYRLLNVRMIWRVFFCLRNGGLVLLCERDVAKRWSEMSRGHMTS